MPERLESGYEEKKEIAGPPPLPDYFKQEAGREGLYEVGRFAVGENRFLSICRENEKGASLMGKIRVVIEDGDGKVVFDFSQFAPLEESWFGGFNYGIYPHTGQEIIGLDSELMAADPRDVMSLLHEIGHALNTKSLRENDPEELQRRKIALEELHRGSVQRGETEPLSGVMEVTLDEERDAWAKGIRLARRIKNEYGADLFKLFKTTDEFFTWMRLTALRSYEIEAERRGTIAISGEDRVQGWIKKNPEATEMLKERSTILQRDLFWKTAREKERKDFVDYIKQNYPDLYSEAENIGPEKSK